MKSCILYLLQTSDEYLETLNKSLRFMEENNPDGDIVLFHEASFTSDYKKLVYDIKGRMLIFVEVESNDIVEDHSILKNYKNYSRIDIGPKRIKAAVIIFHKNINTYPVKWITDCFDSIRNQTYKDFDVFEIDYGGTNQHAYKGSNFESRELKTHADAHNYLLDKVFSMGYDCAFNVNIDDVYSLDRFAKQIISIDQGFDIVSSNYYNIDEQGNHTKIMEMANKDPESEAMKEHNIIAHPCVCYSKHFWTTCDKLKGEEIPFDDFFLWKRSYEKRKYKFLILPDYLLYYRVHEKKISK